MRNPYIDTAADMATAIGALRLKRARIVSTSEGVELHEPGRPVLLLTYAAAQDFAQQRAEAEHG